jgi:hypothetical protein
LYCAEADKLAPAELIPIIGDLAEDDSVELVIEFVSSGYHESASMYGGPDNLGWEENGGEDRQLSHVYLNGDEYPELSKELQEAIFDFYRDRVELEELE